MKATFLHLPLFMADWRHLKLDDEALRELEWTIMDFLESAPVIPGTGGVRKLRFSPSQWHRGKSGAVRVLYAYFQKAEAVALMTAYGKNERSNINAVEKAQLHRLMKLLEQQLQKE